MKSSSARLIFLLGLIGGLLLLSTTIIGNFDGPLRGPGDVEYYGHLSYLFAHLLHWLPLPHLHFQTDLIAFPYGVLAFPQVWCFERDYLSLVLSTLFGDGPWIQIYILLSFSLTAIGSFVMLSLFDSNRRALWASLGISVFNFYCWHKYPGHINFVAAHWTILNVVADFLLCRMIWERKVISLRFLLMRLCLVILALGQDLGAVAGFALMSFTLSFLFLAIFEGKQLWSDRRRWLQRWQEEWRLHRRAVLALSSLLVALTYLYVPLTVQLAYYFRKYAAFSPGTYWANPIRVLVPWLPFFNPANSALNRVIADQPEALGAFSVGWTLLFPALLGVVVIFRRRLAYFAPLLVMLGLILLNQPKIFPTLKIFPWFQYMRASGRSSVVFSTIFTLLIFAIDWKALLRRKVIRIGFMIWILILFSELWTSFVLLQPVHGLRADLGFETYMRRVKESSGEAVLDWPFCLQGGNYEVKGLCLDPERSEPIFAQQRFHTKKVVGLFIGRLSEEMVSRFSEGGWRFIFQRLARQGKDGACFKPEERDFFLNFFKTHDFSGINLYPELLPTSCEREFRSLFGLPVISTQLPGAGRAEFFPRPTDWSVQPGSEGIYRPMLSETVVDLGRPASLDDVELDSFQEEAGNWVLNSRRARVEFFLKKPRTLRVRSKLRSELRGQIVSLRVNGVPVLAPQSVGPDGTSVEYQGEGKEGRNEITFALDKGGEWREIVDLYIQQRGTKGLMNLFALQRFYNSHRRRAATIEQLQIEIH